MKQEKKRVKPPRVLSREEEDFIADSKAALLTHTTSVSGYVLIAIAALVIIALIWSAFAEIDQVTVASGKVIPSSQVKVIQSLDGGIIQEILVKEGQEVQQGQVLLHLDDTRYKADFHEAYQRYLSILGAISRLSAEVNYQDKISFDQKVLQEAPDVVRSETNLFIARKQALARILANLRKSYDLNAEEVTMMEPLVKKGIVAKLDYLRAQRSLNQIKGDFIKTTDEFYEKSWTDLNDEKEKLREIIENLKALKDKMVRTTIVSPVRGVIKKIYFVTIGGVISPGTPIMDIVPLEDTLLIEAYVKSSDIAFIHAGQPATVRVLAYDYTIYGDLKGIVENVSADAIEEDRPVGTTDKPRLYYLVQIRTNKSYLGSEKHKLPIMSGMTVNVSIMTGEKTVLQYLLKPLIKAKAEALRER